MYDLRRKRWLRALQIAELLFEDEGYHTKYIKDLRDFLTNGRGNRESIAGESLANLSPPIHSQNERR